MGTVGVSLMLLGVWLTNVAAIEMADTADMADTTCEGDGADEGSLLQSSSRRPVQSVSSGGPVGDSVQCVLAKRVCAWIMPTGNAPSSAACDAFTGLTQTFCEMFMEGAPGEMVQCLIISSSIGLLCDQAFWDHGRFDLPDCYEGVGGSDCHPSNVQCTPLGFDSAANNEERCCTHYAQVSWGNAQPVSCSGPHSDWEMDLKNAEKVEFFGECESKHRYNEKVLAVSVGTKGHRYEDLCVPCTTVSFEDRRTQCDWMSSTKFTLPYEGDKKIPGGVKTCEFGAPCDGCPNAKVCSYMRSVCPVCRYPNWAPGSSHACTTDVAGRTDTCTVDTPCCKGYKMCQNMDIPACVPLAASCDDACAGPGQAFDGPDGRKFGRCCQKAGERLKSCRHQWDGPTFPPYSKCIPYDSPCRFPTPCPTAAPTPLQWIEYEHTYCGAGRGSTPIKGANPIKNQDGTDAYLSVDDCKSRCVSWQSASCYGLTVRSGWSRGPCYLGTLISSTECDKNAPDWTTYLFSFD